MKEQTLGAVVVLVIDRPPWQVKGLAFLILVIACNDPGRAFLARITRNTVGEAEPLMLGSPVVFVLARSVGEKADTASEASVSPA